MKLKLLIGIGCLMACMICPAAFAQEAPTAEVFGGFATARLSDGGGGMSGWGASVAFNLNDKFAVKLDTNGLYAGVEGCNDCSAQMYNILGGVQYNLLRQDNFTVFVEGLAGLNNSRVNLKVPGLLDVSGSHNGLGLAFGGGVDWKFSDNFTWRVAQLGYLGTRHEGEMGNAFRFQTGILIPLGKK